MKNKLDYINKQVCQREELSKKEDRVSKKGCMNTNTFRKVLLYIEKEKVLKRKGCMIEVWKGRAVLKELVLSKRDRHYGENFA